MEDVISDKLNLQDLKMYWLLDKVGEKGRSHRPREEVIDGAATAPLRHRA